MMPLDDPLARDLRQVRDMPEVPDILRLCAKVSGMGFVAILRVEADRRVVCAALDELGLGLDPGEALAMAAPRCRAVGDPRHDGVLVIEDVEAHDGHGDDPALRRHGFRSHLAVPIARLDGAPFGTLCAFDRAPRPLGPDVVEMFELAARIVAVGLDVRDRIDAERDTARLREEFIAVVGHDLRNPVAAVTAGLRMLGRWPMEDKGAALVAEMQRSLLRMGQILDNLLDFARGRLGAGIELVAPRAVDLAPVIAGVACEVGRMSEQPVELALDLPRPILCDPQRVGQLLSNLLGNAVAHGAPGAPIRVTARDADGRLRIAVTNRGAPIPDAVIPSLFHPFSRGDGSGRTSLQGLGLGLYIASEIARAHGGRLVVETARAATTFAFTMPTAAA